MTHPYPVKWVLIKRFADLTGYTDKAVRRKLDQGVWVEGVHYKRGKDGRILINLEAYDEWVSAA